MPYQNKSSSEQYCAQNHQSKEIYPVKVKRTVATILACIVKDEDMPQDTQMLIDNNHLADQATAVDYRDMILYMNTDNGDHSVLYIVYSIS